MFRQQVPGTNRRKSHLFFFDHGLVTPGSRIHVDFVSSNTAHLDKNNVNSSQEC